MKNALSLYLLSLSKRGLKTFTDLIKVMLPVVILVKIASDLGLIDLLAPALKPLMFLVGLPEETGFVWMAALLTGVYGGIGAFPILAQEGLTVGQLSILCAMILFAHALPVEQAIVKRAGASFWFTAALRFFTALLYGVLANLFLKFTGLLSAPADLGVFASMGGKNVSFTDWVIGSLSSFGFILAIIFVLLILLDLFERFGITAFLTRLMMPVLRFSGLNDQTAPVTTIGILMGLTYGGGLIIQQAREGRMDKKMLFLALCWLSLFHAVIEDTLLLIAIGGNVWIILIGRLLLTLLIIKMIAKVMELDMSNIFKGGLRPRRGL